MLEFLRDLRLERLIGIDANLNFLAVLSDHEHLLAVGTRNDADPLFVGRYGNPQADYSRHNFTSQPLFVSACYAHSARRIRAVL